MIETLKLQNVRNIQTADLSLANRLNVFVGTNGSGKSSFLEAIHILSRAKSFRASTLRPVVQHGATSFTVFAKIGTKNSNIHTLNGEHRLGLSFDASEGKSARLDGVSVKSTSDLARHLSVIYFGPESLSLLRGPPEQRRNFLDWGLFHVEHTFLPLAQRYSRALKQRNAALKQKMPASQINIWNSELIETGMALSTMRSTYLEKLWSVFRTSLDLMSPEIRWGNDLAWRYDRGWAEHIDLQESLTTSFEQDKSVGFTRYGPHRADMILLGYQRPLRDQISAGQTKVLVCALLLGQAKLIKNVTNLFPILMVDDLHSELDKQHRTRVLNALADNDTQFLITATEKTLIASDIIRPGGSMFHVEQGVITKQSS